jgi:hypothetical protein
MLTTLKLADFLLDSNFQGSLSKDDCLRWALSGLGSQQTTPHVDDDDLWPIFVIQHSCSPAYIALCPLGCPTHLPTCLPHLLRRPQTLLHTRD